MASVMTCVKFKAEHFNFIVENEMHDQKLKPYIAKGRGEYLEKRDEHVFTVLEGEKPVLVGGVHTFWKGRGEAWLIFGKPKTENFGTIFKMVQRLLTIILDTKEYTRIEMTVDYDFVQGHRWARLLGFKKEAEILRKYQPHGGDASLYAMVRE